MQQGTSADNIFRCIFRSRPLKSYSNKSRIYSQWLNSVIYWLINHFMNWEPTGVTSFDHQSDFHGIIYHIQHCKVDNRQHNIVFTTIGRSKCTCTLKYVLQSKQELQENLTVCSRWWNHYRL